MKIKLKNDTKPVAICNFAVDFDNGKVWSPFDGKKISNFNKVDYYELDIKSTNIITDVNVVRIGKEGLMNFKVNSENKITVIYSYSPKHKKHFVHGIVINNYANDFIVYVCDKENKFTVSENMINEEIEVEMPKQNEKIFITYDNTDSRISSKSKFLVYNTYRLLNTFFFKEKKEIFGNHWKFLIDIDKNHILGYHKFDKWVFFRKNIVLLFQPQEVFLSQIYADVKGYVYKANTLNELLEKLKEKENINYINSGIYTTIILPNGNATMFFRDEFIQNFNHEFKLWYNINDIVVHYNYYNRNLSTNAILRELNRNLIETIFTSDVIKQVKSDKIMTRELIDDAVNFFSKFHTKIENPILEIVDMSFEQAVKFTYSDVVCCSLRKDLIKVLNYVYYKNYADVLENNLKTEMKRKIQIGEKIYVV